MHFVYLLRSVHHPERRYVGCTNDIRRRLAEHNAGKSVYTAKQRPWRFVAAIPFPDAERAFAIERRIATNARMSATELNWRMCAVLFGAATLYNIVAHARALVHWCREHRAPPTTGCSDA